VKSLVNFVSKIEKLKKLNIVIYASKLEDDDLQKTLVSNASKDRIESTTIFVKKSKYAFDMHRA